MNALQTSENAQGKRICVDSETTILAASRLMRSFQAEELVVTHRPTNALVPVGIVSARDIVTRIVAAELDPAVLTAGDIAWVDPTGAAAADAVSDSLRSVLAKGSRVLPVLDCKGDLKGVVSLDELLRALPQTRPQ